MFDNPLAAPSKIRKSGMFENPLAGTELPVVEGVAKDVGILRQEMVAMRTDMQGSWRQEMAAMRTDMQGNLQQELAAMRQEMQRLLASQKL